MIFRMLSCAGERDNTVLREHGLSSSQRPCYRKQGPNPRKIVGYSIVGV